MVLLNHSTVRYNRDKHKSDVAWLAKRLREQDIKELELTETSLEDTINKPGFDAFITYDEIGLPLAAFGCSQDYMMGYGHLVWMIGRKDLDRPCYRKLVVRLGQEYIQDFIERYGVLWNMILTTNEKSKCWLKDNGASFSNAFEYNNHEWNLFMIRGEGNVRRISHAGLDGSTGNTAI